MEGEQGATAPVLAAELLGPGEAGLARLLDEVRDGRRRRHHVHDARLVLRGASAQGPDVVDHPGRAAVGPDHEVVVPRVDDERAHGDGGEALAPRLPVSATVLAQPQAGLGAQEEQVGVDRVLLQGVGMADDALEVQPLERRSSVVGPVEVRLTIAPPVAVQDDVGAGSVVAARLDVRDPGVQRDPLELAVQRLPLAVGRAPPELAVVGADPQQTLLQLARRDREDRAVVLGRRDVTTQTARLGLALPARLVGGEVGADRRPGVPHVPREVHELAAVEECVGVEGVEREARVPGEAQLDALGSIGADRGPLARHVVPAVQGAPLAHAVPAGRRARQRHAAEAVPEADLTPVVVADPPVLPDGGGPTPGAVVLHAAVDVVGDVHVDGDVVVLREGQVPDEAPALPAVDRERDPAVVAVHHPVRIGGVDPEGVVVRVDEVVRHELLEAGAPVL